MQVRCYNPALNCPTISSDDHPRDPAKESGTGATRRYPYTTWYMARRLRSSPLARSTPADVCDAIVYRISKMARELRGFG